jgi:hypothetical protein
MPYLLVRHDVVGSSGTKSAEGSRFEAMMTVVATLTQQHRNVFDCPTIACAVAIYTEPARSLRPSPGDFEKLRCPTA